METYAPRKKFETVDTRTAEGVVINKILKGYGMYAVHLPPSHYVDYAILGEMDHTKRHPILVWVEVKCRDTLPNEYPDIPFSLEKCMNGLRKSAHTGIPLILAYGFKDGSVYTRVIQKSDTLLPLYWWGRTNPRDKFDSEPCIMFTMDQLTKFE